MANDAPWNVFFAAGALDDLVGIIRYLLENDDVARARELSALMQTDVRQRLTALPHRGLPVPELAHMGHECREIHCRSYRILYQPVEAERTVWILLIAHTRRSIQDMLRDRLLQYPAQR